ncbi:hypothetical protein ALP40_200096 [Pseudomonas viridiflava]|uniref:Uncharacterized protein n=1 Tax=Pseudomonas viridiflava TaxID=33069 RepID=A0A3M5PER3_PSEVI|nr:hypothetical protein ALP40_200096 [Pseudomonas viridiflava]
MALGAAAVIAEYGEADGLTDELLGIVFGVLHQHVEGVARHTAKALDAVDAQGLQLMLAQGRGELQEAAALAEGGSEGQVHGALLHYGLHRMTA